MRLMADLFIKILEKLIAIVKWLRGPVQAEVRYFRYEEINNEPSDALWIIGSNPRSYSVTLLLTNRFGLAVYIKTISLRINREKNYRQADIAQSIRLEAGESKEYQTVFPLSSGETPLENGEFRIEIAPAVGRKTSVSGRFPVK